MVALEWVLLVWLGLNVVAGTYYATQGGFHYSRNERLFGLAVNLLMVVVLFLSAPLTWVGWVLTLIFGYNIVVSVIRSVANPGGSWVGATHNVIDVFISIALFILILTVGVVV